MQSLHSPKVCLKTTLLLAIHVNKGLKKKQATCLVTLREEKEDTMRDPCLRQSKEFLESLRV